MQRARGQTSQKRVANAGAIRVECGGVPPLLRKFDTGEKNAPGEAPLARLNLVLPITPRKRRRAAALHTRNERR